MKIYKLCWLAVVVLILTGCGAAQTDMVYSFFGEGEGICVYNGVIVLSDEKDVFYGGNLSAREDVSFDDLISYSARFYLASGAQRQTILLHRSEIMTDSEGSVLLVPAVDFALGKRTGRDLFVKDSPPGEKDWKDHLYFELVTKNASGEESVYSVKLSLKAVTE